MSLLETLWDGEDEGREARVQAELMRSGIDHARHAIVLTRILPIVPELKERSREAGNRTDVLLCFGALVSDVIAGKVEFPDTIDGILEAIRRRIELSTSVV